MLTNILTKKYINGGMKLFEVESTANLQASHSKSLRTTIPTEVVKALNLSEKDKICWTIFAEDDELVIKVEKKQ